MSDHKNPAITTPIGVYAYNIQDDSDKIMIGMPQ